MLADHGIFMDYPELQDLSSEKVAIEEVLSPNKKGGYKSRKIKFKVRILIAVSEVLDKVLNDGKKLMQIGKGMAYYPVELILATDG